MRDKKKAYKARMASHKVLLASVSKEMAQPRMTQSAKLRTDRQIKATDGKAL
jgi:hypothetical protein